MFNDEFKKHSVNKIFNDMDYEGKTNDIKFQVGDGSINISKEIEISNELNQVLKITKEPKLFDAAVETAVKIQNKWKNSSALKRANSLHKIWKTLKEISKSLPKAKNELSIFIDYFDFYSDLTLQTEEYKCWRPIGVVLIVLSNSSPFFVLGTTVPPALATGSSVIVLAPERAQTVCLFLEQIIAEVGLPEGLFNVVVDYDKMNTSLSKKINKVFFCGSYASAQKVYMKNSAKSFNFFSPNNTAAFILESCDLNSAVDKIVSETWGKNFPFAVSNVIVQEAIYQQFLEKLKYRMEQFMIENKNCSKFKDSLISEKINKVILEAISAGASVEKSSNYGNEWSPTVIVNYQNQDIYEDVPILKVLLCRTAKEGVTLLNNCRFNLGISIWSEISAQALEISSTLICPNIWINCHGVFDAGEPLQLFGFSGDCVLGGSDGILEYMSFRMDEPVEGNKNEEDGGSNAEKVKLLEVAAEAQQAFYFWQKIKNRRKYLKDIANTLGASKEFSNLSETISVYAHFGNIVNISDRNSAEEFLIVKKKVSVGLILLIVNNSNIDVESLVCLITPTIALGNALIIVLREKNAAVNLLIKHFSNTLPKNVLNVIIGVKAGIHLSSDPNIQAIWLYDESTISSEFFQAIKSHSVRSLKRIWVIPKHIFFSQHLFQKEGLRNKVVWLTKIDQFP